jgi:hypothetical protein
LGKVTTEGEISHADSETETEQNDETLDDIVEAICIRIFILARVK